ncbi:Asp23/Gls24 family envelope stress response protein [Streptomyces sp. NPDC058757]|uniref:Asp23/Gls24 family envelope stress response protein n=1 Tax=unclassified Streptomyces TaxID=2593676 RepID=UPI00367DD384
MNSDPSQALAQRVADAVLAVPGVACLRPGLRSLLRTAASRQPDAGDPRDPGSAVRITFDARGRVAALRVDVVVRARHQAARTAGAVRAAAAEAAATTPGAVRVTVTGIV